MLYNQYKEAVTRIPSRGVLRFDSIGMYTGVELSNYLRKVLYVMSADGNIHMIVPRSGFQYVKDTSPKICVSVDARFDSEPVEGVVRSMDNITGRKTDIYITKIDELYTTRGTPTAVYLPQANVSVSLINDPVLLRQAHPYLASPIDPECIGGEEIIVNLYDTSVKYIYVKNVSGISKIPVMHNKLKPECIDIKRRDENGNRRVYRLTITSDVDLQCVDVGYKRFGLVIGLSSEKVHSRFHELHDKVSDELYSTKKKIAILTKEIDAIKEENTILKKQIDSAVTKEEEIHEINALKLKADIANAEYAKNKARIESDMELMPVQVQRDNQKAAIDLAIANSKLAVAESDNVAQTWKSTAVIAGAAVTLGAIVTKIYTTTASISAATISAPSVLAVGAAAVAVTTLSSKKFRRSVANKTKKVCNAIKNTWESIGSTLFTKANDAVRITRKVIDTTVDCGKKLIDRCTTAVTTVCNTVVNVTKSICGFVSRGICSIFG